jgi:peptidoglycan/xylan/chitin deacetylase (PgdA/CDA1 family)
MQFNLGRTRYLLRFDDICPTMNWEVWREVEAVLIEKDLKPLLAVVPDNQDQTLNVHPPVNNFWDHVRRWQSRGWTVGVHGYQHRYISRHRGIVTARRKSEFAGVSAIEQEDKLRRATDIFEGQGVRSRVWISPGHSFDDTTVSLLPKFGLDIISDGYFRFPFVCRKQMLWIPQQLSYFRPVPPGIWTVCHHINRWNKEAINRFVQDLDRYVRKIGSVEETVQESFGLAPQYAWFCRRPWLSPFLIRFKLKLWNTWKSAMENSVQAREA